MSALALALAVPVSLAADLPAPAGEVRYAVGLHAWDARESTAEFQGARVLRADEALRMLVVATDDPAFPARAAADANVRYVDRDDLLPLALFTPNDPRYASMYGPQQIGAPAAWDITLGSTSAVVCVTDTGVRSTHEDLAGARLLSGYDYVNNDADPWDDQGHGTHVQGTAAASTHNGKGIAGVAQASMRHVKVLDSGGSGYLSDVASGMRWCADAGAHVVSMSLGGSSTTSSLADAVDYAWSKGAVIVAAAGNDGPCSNCVLWPAKYAKVVAVSCTTSSKALCSFSSTGPEVDLAAPGSNIDSTCYTSNTAYCTKSGTSMSTPHVAGAAALVKSARPGATNQQIRDDLEAKAEDLGAAGRDNSFGWGLVKPAGAMGNLAPVLETFSCAPARVAVGDSVTCTVKAVDDSPGVAYALDWGDGAATRVPASGFLAPGAAQTVTHAYAAAGTFTASASATDDGTPARSSETRNATTQVLTCLLTRSGTLLVGVLGVAQEGYASRTERNIPPGCSGATFLLTGSGAADDFDVCWMRNATVLRCDETVGAERGLVPDGANSARVFYYSGVRGTYTLELPDPYGGAPAFAVRDDDGGMEATFDLDYQDDYGVKTLVVPASALAVASSAKLWTYGQSYGCTGTWRDTLEVNGVVLAQFDPCGVWPATGFAWRSFAVPLDLLRAGSNTVRMEEVPLGSWTSRNVFLGIDRTTDLGRSTISMNGEDQPGELMWYLEFTA